jgi:hypothetical protein
MYGSTVRHNEIRVRLVEYVRENADYFMHFVPDVGGERRGPRRAAASEAKLSSNTMGRIATKSGQRAKFEAMVNQMEKTGVWGGSVEIQAFCQAYGKDVNVYSDFGIQNFTSSSDLSEGDDGERDVIHLAYHVSHVLADYLT